MTMTPPPAAPSSSRNGIDIRDALSILSARPRNDVAHSSVSDEMKRMGQTIDVAGGADSSSSSSSSPVEEKEDVRETTKAERERRNEEIRSRLRSMDVADLLAAVFSAQRERVATYRTYEEGLSAVLASGNVSGYPPLCASVTATFSALSDAINAVKSVLAEDEEKNKNRNRRDAADAIAALQKAEGEKLSLTAACHLERLRSRNARLESGGGGESDEAVGTTTAGLLEEGVRTLERRIAGTVEGINEALEELRCIAAEEGEDA